MKKFLILVLIILIIFTVGCLDNYVPIEEYNSKVSELEEANNKTEAKTKEILELKEEVNTLENDLGLTGVELEKYRSLINNLNELLKNIYYVYGESNGTYVCGTGFSLEYKNKVYLITAGHAVEDRDRRYYNHRFKANFSNDWIYPKLLAYENDYLYYNDYAIFYSKEIKEGLKIDYDNDYSRFLLGTINNNLNVIRENKNWGKDGESGSPAIDLDGEVTAILIGYITPIERVTEAIDNLE